MSVTLVIEAAPGGQAGQRHAFEGGELVIGRGPDADWQIDDPEMFVSRRHFMISLQNDRPHVTDMSRGGLFVDGAEAPLGAGNSRALEPGMRLRLGDVVIRVDMDGAAPARLKPAETDYRIEPAAEPEPQREARPSTLPDPFGFRQDDRRGPQPSTAPPRPLDQDDPFALDLKPAGPTASAAPRGGYFDSAPAEPTPAPEPPSRRATPPPEPSLPRPAASAPPTRAPAGHHVGDAELRAAFLRGMGLDPAAFPADDPAKEMEEMGQRFRALVDGLMHLLRTRAVEKRDGGLPTTVISSADVNPLKFLPTSAEALGALVAPRGAGYLAPDAAIAGAFRDLGDHQMRNWTALQSSLRRMIDQFDPATIETEADKAGMLETLLAGGRKAKLWQVYEARYRQIAKSAEDRFLGEVGAGFRDAYEGKERRR